MKSAIRELGTVEFPEHTGERVYMVKFTKKDGLPANLARWQSTVDQMMARIEGWTYGYLMIDQGEVKAGQLHRRGGPHVDGNWIEASKDHGGSSGHGATGDWPPSTGHRPTHQQGDEWRAEHFSPEALVLATDVEACVGYIGEIEGHPKVGGDCTHLDFTNTKKVLLRKNVAYSGNVTMVHESLPIFKDCKRTLVRINVPNVEI